MTERFGFSSSEPRAPLSPRDRLLSLSLVAGITLLRLIFASAVPLVPDETYYWEWSRQLAAGYFDHPPAIAWFIAAGTAILGDTSLGVRLFSVLGGGVAALALVEAARRVGGDRAGLLAAVIQACLPLAAAGLVLATPDAPLFTFASLALLFIVRAFQAEPGSSSALRWWMLAGLAQGMAFLGKYTAVLLPLGVLIAVLAHPTLRVRLREPGPYVAVILASLVFAPVLVWNAGHDWISIRFQLAHGFGTPRGSAFMRELELIGGQMALVSPVLFVLMGVAAWRAIRRRAEPLRLMLAITFLTPLAFFAVSALRKPVEANWPALAYLPALVLLAGTPFVFPRERRWLHGGLALGAGLVLVVYVQAIHPVLPVAPRKDPVARAHGWDTMAAGVADEQRRLARGGERSWAAADRYQEASQLAFHLPGRPQTFSLNLGGRANQYDLWVRFPERAAPQDALVVTLGETDDTHPVVQRLEPHFDLVERGPMVERRRGEGVIERRRIWVLRGWRGTWPTQDG